MVRGLLRSLFGQPWGYGDGARPKPGVAIDDEEEDPDTIDYPRGEHGGLKLMITAPNLQFIVGNEHASAG